MNIIGSLFRNRKREEIIQWISFDLEKLETSAESTLFTAEKGLLAEGEYIIARQKKKIYRRRLKNKELLSFTEDLKMSLNAGMTLLEALDISKENIENSEIALRSEEIKKSLKKGDNLTRAWKKSFPENEGEIINIISLYEESGAIALGFEKISFYLNEKIARKKKLLETMYYPVFVLILASFVFIWFINFFIPSILIMLKDILSYQDYLNIQKIYKTIRIAVNGGGVFVLFFILYFLVSKNFRKNILKKLIVFRPFKKILDAYYLEAFTHHFNQLINSGFSLIKILDILRKDETFDFCKEESEKSIKIILEGHPLSQGLEVYSFIQKRDLEKIKKGEIRGRLAETFSHLHVQAQNKKKFYFSEILSFAEPFMILASGLVVGLSLYLFYKILFSYTLSLI